MGYQKEINRDQLTMLFFDEHIAQDNPVRVIDAFLGCSDFDALGFSSKGKFKSGKPAFKTSILVGIYIYSYLNKIRSSRMIEQECRRNIELWWLTKRQTPGYKTISNFRKDNPEAFDHLFNHFREFCLSLGLYGRERVAIDGSKFRAVNSKKNNYNAKKVDAQLNHINAKFDEYLNQLDETDDAEEKEQIQNKVDHLKTKTKKYEQIRNRLESSDDLQISTNDASARALPGRGFSTEVGYNIQTTVDDAHNLVADFKVTNQTDEKALTEMALRAKEFLHITDDESLTVIADKGYPTAEELHKCHNENIDTLVAPKAIQNKSKSQGYTIEKFTYSKAANCYKCPQGNELHTDGEIKTIKSKTRKSRKTYRYMISFSKCKQCPQFEKCISKSSRARRQGRVFYRSIHQDAVEKNTAEVKARWEEYRRRQAIVEHPFGTIKRTMGYTHTLMKGMKKVTGEFSIIFLCYNLKRVMNILGTEELKKALKGLKSTFLSSWRFMMSHIVDISTIICSAYNASRLISVASSSREGRNFAV